MPGFVYYQNLYQQHTRIGAIWWAMNGGAFSWHWQTARMGTSGVHGCLLHRRCVDAKPRLLLCHHFRTFVTIHVHTPPLTCVCLSVVVLWFAVSRDAMCSVHHCRAEISAVLSQGIHTIALLIVCLDQIIPLAHAAGPRDTQDGAARRRTDTCVTLLTKKVTHSLLSDAARDHRPL